MIKIGLLIDDLVLKNWQHEILEFIISHPFLELEIFIIRNEKSNYSSDSSLLYRFSQALDRKIFKVENDIFGTVDIQGYVQKMPVLRIAGVEKKFSYQFPDEKIDEIKTMNLDVLIRFGFGILKGEILQAAKYGVWSLHHGDNRINRGGPPAFWEVVNKEEVTGITLQQLSEDLDGGKVISRSFIKTDATSFYRNKYQAFWAGVELFTFSLDRLAKKELDFENLEQTSLLDIYSHPLYKDPGNWESLQIMFKFWGRRLIELFEEKVLTPRWHIYYRYNVSEIPEKSLFRYKPLYPPKGYDWADPFVVKNGDFFYLFFEELDISTRKAHISYLKFNQKGVLFDNKPIKIIDESYHLSYPFIFKNEENYYLLPESADIGELWLYEAIEFPKKWKKMHRILDKVIYDASLFFHEGYWYLFGTEKISKGGSRDQYLQIYYSADLFGTNWIAHPKNPVTMDVRGARPAGKIFKTSNKIYRPGQIGAPKYGYGVQFYEITALSTVEYKEIKVNQILPKWGKELLATHTFNFEKGFSVIDAQGYF